MLFSNFKLLLEADDEEKISKDLDKEIDAVEDDKASETEEDSDTTDNDSNDDDEKLFKDVDDEMDEINDDSGEDSDTSVDGEDGNDGNNEDNIDDDSSSDEDDTELDTNETSSEEQDPYSKIENIKNTNKRKKLLLDIIELYNYYETLAVRLNGLTNLDEEESNDVDVCIKKVYETKGLIFNYIQTMFMKDSYERALSLYYSFKIPSNFIYKIITKIAEKRNNN